MQQTQTMALAALVASLFLMASSATSREGHPVANVIALLQQLTEDVKEKGKVEEVTYAKFETWCSTSTKTLDTAIAAGKESIDVLSNTIKSKTEEEAALTADINSLASEIEKYQAAAVQAKSQRDSAANLYSLSDADLESTILAIEEALTALLASKAPSLLQEVNSLMHFPLVLEQLTDSQRRTLFGSQSPAPAQPTYDDVFAKGDFASHQKTYTFKSGDVIELLKDLKAHFEDARVEGTKAETNSVNAYSLAKDARDNAEEAATDAKGEKELSLGDAQAALSQAQSELTDVKNTLEADTANLESTKKACNIKKSEWAERTAIREHEIQAMAAGIEILAKVSGVRTEAPSNPILPASPLAFFENATSPAVAISALIKTTQIDPKQRAVKLLREEARATHSRDLQRFAEEVEAHLSGPFDEVNNMIQKMIFRLMAEQKDEDDHKNWCDLEMSKTNASEIDKTGKIATFNLKIEEAKASAELLTNEIKVASDMVATLTSHMAQATEIREAGKAENKVAIADAKSAQEALAKATAVLEDFYKSSGMMTKEAWELLQTEQPVVLPTEPSTWTSEYMGIAKPEEPGGVITLLKTIATDFARMEADTQAQEEMDQKAFDEEIKSCEIEKARSAKEVEMKDQEKKRLLDKVNTMEKSLKHVQDELYAVKQYWKDLGPACMEGDSTYETRKASRDQEIAALKEAQVILADAFKGVAAAPAPAVAASAFLSPVKRRAPVH